MHAPTQNSGGTKRVEKTRMPYKMHINVITDVPLKRSKLQRQGIQEAFCFLRPFLLEALGLGAGSAARFFMDLGVVFFFFLLGFTSSSSSSSPWFFAWILFPAWMAFLNSLARVAKNKRNLYIAHCVLEQMQVSEFRFVETNFYCIKRLAWIEHLIRSAPHTSPICEIGVYSRGLV